MDNRGQRTGDGDKGTGRGERGFRFRPRPVDFVISGVVAVVSLDRSFVFGKSTLLEQSRYTSSRQGGLARSI